MQADMGQPVNTAQVACYKVATNRSADFVRTSIARMVYLVRILDKAPAIDITDV